MKILAMDSSGLVASVAMIEDDVVRAEYTINYKKTHSQTLLPMIDEIVSMTEVDLDTVDAIAVAGGPGSFTGLRIGSATAKGLGLALDKPIVSVPTVVGLAYNYLGYTQLVCPIMDARRNQVYTGVYGFDNDCLVTYMQQSALDIDELLSCISEILEKANQNLSVVFLGDGVAVYKAHIDEIATFKHSYAPAHMNGQSAAALGVCACQMYQNGIIEKAEEHKPEYLRMSQAERERAERERAVQESTT